MQSIEFVGLNFEISDLEHEILNVQTCTISQEIVIADFHVSLLFGMGILAQASVCSAGRQTTARRAVAGPVLWGGQPHFHSAKLRQK